MIQAEAASQNMTYEEIARRNQEIKANATEIWYISHESLASNLQIFVSLRSRTTTPADEQAAASDSIAVTCTIVRWISTKTSKCRDTIKMSFLTQKMKYNQIT